MDLSTYNLTPLKVLKIVIFGLIALLATLFIGMFVLSIMSTGLGFQSRNTSYAPSLQAPQSPGFGVRGGSIFATDSFSNVPTMSTRNVTSMPSGSGMTTGSDAEAFEVGEHSASIETRNKEGDCQTIADLRSRDYVIFESMNETKRVCTFSFKVKREHAHEVLGVIEGLHPKDLSDTTYTIQQQVSDYTNQIQILENKRASIDETLSKALVAYDEITAIATQSKDAASLAQIIDSKVGVIERLTQQRIDINTALDALERQRVAQLDRLNYTHFAVSVYENKYIDREKIVDSWKASIRSFSESANWSAQTATISLLRTIVVVLPFLLYALLLLILAKYSYRIGKRIWTS